ncbi:glycosyltransferase [Nitrosomonas ureae]|uniref:Glycosyltransferase, GT2 family n=1 Tax=Nitrosomonas ureae TaxID=44577 RepID=A0A1H5UHM6_9PROT|nr:glycosyltransferase [Nitrosomonas ureae]SEF74536.1 Glycosyltransferase, GT2 family [Nitrosomonas ureae]
MKPVPRLPYALSDYLSIALEKLDDNDLISAFRYADRACRLSKFPNANALIVRATVLSKRGYLTDAIHDLKTVSLLMPGNHNISFSLLRLCWSDLKNHQKLFNQSLISLLRQAPTLCFNSEVATWIAGSGISAMGAAWREDEFITGWAVNTNDLESSVLIELDGDFFSVGTGIPTPWLATTGIGNGHNGFRLKLPASFNLLRIGISGNSLWGCPFVGNKHLVPTLPSSVTPPNIVDVIVPVFLGRSETLACLDAIRASNISVPHRIIVVDDCSTDENLRTALRQRAQRKEIVLVSRPINAGFSGAVNTALTLDNNHDVILLNADTLVYGNWLDRMQAAAYQSDDIATVTPLSNHGELASYPLPMQNNPVFNAKHAELIDQLFNSIGPKEAIDIPVGVGFCLYIKRKALNEIGLLNEGLYGRGYGEDTDFCLRLQARGWRNVCAANVYVVHWGSRSFNDEKQYLVAQNLPRLHAGYPHHSDEYEQFLADDPLYDLRRKIQRFLLAKVVPQYKGTLQIGTSDFNEGIAFTLKSIEKRHNQWQVNLTISGITGLDTIKYAWPEQSIELRDDLSAAGFKNLELKTFGEWPAEIIDYLTGGFIPYDMALEDYSGYCPRKYRLIRNAVICDDPVDTNECARCITELGPLVYNFRDIATWQERAQRILSKAKKISLLNDEMRNAYIRRFPKLGGRIVIGGSNNLDNSFSNRKNEVSSKSQATVSLFTKLKEPLNIAVLSARSLDEGYLQLIEQAKKAIEQHLAIMFIVLGDTMNDANLQQLPNIHLTGKVPEAQIPDVLRLHNCSAIGNYSPCVHRRIQVAKVAQRFELPLVHGCMSE